MPAPAKIDRLPEELRRLLDNQIVARAFSGYCELEAWLSDQGYEIGKTAIWKHGQRLKQRMEAIKTSTQAAQALHDSLPDDSAVLPAAVMALVQSEMFELLVTLQEADATDDPAQRAKLLGTIARAMAQSTRAALAQKKWASDLKSRLETLLEESAEGKNDLDIATLKRIRTEVYGLAA